MDLPGSVLRDAERTESGVEKKRKVRHDTDKHTEMNLPRPFLAVVALLR